MKILNTTFLTLTIFLISGCIPDSFTNWNLAPPSSQNSGTSGAVPGQPSTNNPPAPTSIAYTPEPPVYEFNLTKDASSTITDLVPISTGGGEITEGFITFSLAQVQDVNGVSTKTVWPNTLSMDPNTGIISGRPNQFINHNTYTINALPLGAITPIQTKIMISMATRPEALIYPQKNGQNLLLEVSTPQNFAVGDPISGQNNSKGTVTSVDQKNRIIYATVSCTSPNGVCPNFNVGDKIDNKSSYFIEQSTINKVVYGFTTTTGITNMTPIVNPPEISSQLPQFAISPKLPTGINFNSTTGQISGTPTAQLPNTQYTVTVKNIINQTANVILNLQVLAVATPTSPDKVEYAYRGGDRIVLELTDINTFPAGGKISNKDGTVGTVIGNLTVAGNGGAGGTQNITLVDIDLNSSSSFKANELVDNGYPYILPATTIGAAEPILVHKIKSPFNFPPILSPNLTDSDKLTLTWKSEPELPHLCQSIASTPTTYFIENTNDPLDAASCTNAHGTCSIPAYTNAIACASATPTAGTWTTSAKFLTEYKDELWFNRRTGVFGADNPQKTFPGRTFTVSVTSLTGVTLNTTTAISFEDIPKNLSYNSDVLLEVDDDSAFDIGDLVSSDGNGVGVITYKFTSSPQTGTPTYTGTNKILVVRATSGQFQEGEDIDNVFPFTYQKGEIIRARYNSMGIIVNNLSNFKRDEEVFSTAPTNSRGIINYIDPNQNALWVSLINTTDSSNPLTSFSNNGNPAISALATSSGGSGSSANIYGIIGDNVTINQNNATTFSPGYDVTSNVPTQVLDCSAALWANPMPLGAGFNGVNPRNACWTANIYTPAVRVSGSVFYINRTSDFGVTIQTDRTNLVNPTALSKDYTAVFVSNGVTWNYQGAIPNTMLSYLNSAAMANSASGNNVSVSVANGKFLSSLNLFRLNPTNSTDASQGSSVINNVTSNPIFYLDRYGTSGIQPSINSPPNNGVTYAINPALPSGLSLDTSTGQISVVAPGPVASALKNYTIVASNFLGTTSFTFGLAVREVFSISDITGTDGNITGILHKSGQGYSRFPCRITQEQIKSQATANSRGKNINCLYDVGEGDLYQNGLELQVNVGSNLCVYVEHVPYFFYQSQYIKTVPNPAAPVMQHTGDYQNILCAPGQPTGTIAEFPNGPPSNQCLGNQGGVQCDDGKVSTIQRDYTLQGVCYNTATPLAIAGGFNGCFDAAAYCSNAALVTRANCLNANQAWNSRNAFINNQCYLIRPETDAGTCSDNYGACNGAAGANRSQCVANGGSWATTGSFANNSNCFSTAGIPGPDYECGGEQINCINGPAKDDLNFPQSKLTGRFGTPLRGYALKVGVDPIQFTYSSPLSKNYQTNIYLSNFSRTNSCTPFNGNVYEYNMSTWFNVGMNRNPAGAQGVNSPFSGGNGVYAIRCLDGAANIIGQINLLIREWDHDFKAKDGTDIMNFTGNPIDVGTTDPFGYPENAYEDWDNKTTGTPTCSVPTYTYPGSGL